MEELEELLKNYNLSHLEDLLVSPWSKQYCRKPFPKYWQLVYQIMDKLNRDNKIIEIGCGQGDVTSILCYLGFNRVNSFEKVPELASNAKRRMKDLFGRSDIIVNGEFPERQSFSSDILILVNCAYKDMASNKTDYLKLMQHYYSAAGLPHYFIMEVIDASYLQKNDEFPEYIRLSHKDVEELFPDFIIQSWPTYTYPQNKKSKTLYLLEKK